MDIVYTWCDGSDRYWRQKRDETFSSISDISFLEKYSNVEGRFRDNGELKYALRSLEKYYPEHGRVHIISDRQVPSYLKDTSNVNFIFHDQFLPESILPTFSSKAIESMIPFIPDISERFLYLNDDVFFAPGFSVDSLIYEGQPQYYFFQDKNGVESELNNQGILSAEKLGDNFLSLFQSAHAPKIVNKETYHSMYSQYQNEFNKTQNEKFRDRRNLSLLSDFYPRWMIKNKLAEKVFLDNDCSVGTSTHDYTLITRKFLQIPFFGVNDTSDNVEADHPDLLGAITFLESLFPEKSSFEI